ncbi:MAG: SRPBCC family protein [Sphingomonadaceae bacterium]|nr:SRPBCC family protein [Sphingomonadaceae bacterium]
MITDPGALLESGAIRFERLLPGPIERVWAYLVDPDKRATWFCGGTEPSRAGETLTFFFDHKAMSGEPYPERFANMEDGVSIDAEVTAFEPPRLLAWEWEGERTRVELAEEGDKVRLVLTEGPLAAREKKIGNAAGWQAHLGVLEDRLAGRPLRGFWSVHAEAEEYYGERG